MHTKYHNLGQLSALAILTIGRGPSCLNKLLAHTVFETPDCSLMLLKEDLEGDISSFVDVNITPSENLTPNKEMFINFYCITSRAAATGHFRNGVNSISKEIKKENTALNHSLCMKNH